MRIGFITCVQLGLSCMETIYRVGGRLEFAGTLLDEQAVNKSGRVYLDDFCRAHGVPLSKFRNCNDPDALAAVDAAKLDWLMIVGWSQIARAPLLALPTRGTLGMHPTLLPEGRGRAAIPWAILKGLSETGVTLFKLEEGVDTGPIAGQIRIQIAPDETATSLYERVNNAHSDLLGRCWPSLMDGNLKFEVQDESRASVWPGRKPEDGALISAASLVDAERLVRAVTRPYPGAFMDLCGHRIRVWRALARAGLSDCVTDLSQVTPLIQFDGGALELVEWQIEETMTRLP